MPRSASYVETEVKLSVESAGIARRILRAAGFRIHARRVFEVNIVFDTAQSDMRANRQVLRLRTVGAHSILTFKGAPRPGAYKSRREIESAVSDPDAVSGILSGLGFAPVFRYEKFRTTYRHPLLTGIVTLDETPVGVFLEIEAKPREIDRSARALGYSADDYLTVSYGRLYLEYCRDAGVKPGHMVFSRRK